jgi:hypothetical protein
LIFNFSFVGLKNNAKLHILILRDTHNIIESAFIPFVSFGDLDNNTFKGLTSLLSVEQEIQYDEHT